MRMRSIVWAALLSVAFAALSFGQQPAARGPESQKYRTIFTIAGGGGGFTLGVIAGIGAFDDSTYASRKVWTTALISAAGGAVGGYFLGRALDKRGKGKKVVQAPRWVPDILDRSLTAARLPREKSVGSDPPLGVEAHRPAESR
jgi:hypothetical protein